MLQSSKNASARRNHKNALAAAWVRAHFPKVWETMCEVAFKKYPLKIERTQLLGTARLKLPKTLRANGQAPSEGKP